jgi:hypothetical protein
MTTSDIPGTTRSPSAARKTRPILEALLLVDDPAEDYRITIWPAADGAIAGGQTWEVERFVDGVRTGDAVLRSAGITYATSITLSSAVAMLGARWLAPVISSVLRGRPAEGGTPLPRRAP